jgi:hypothetical protein
MGTFASIKDRVETRIIDLPAAVLAEVGTLVNKAMVRLQQTHNFKVMEALIEATTTVATRTLVAVPANFKEFRGEPYYVTDDGSTFPMTVVSSKEALWPATDEEAEGYPRYILDGLPSEAGDRSLEVYPLPDGNSDWTGGEYRIKVPYWRFVTELSGDADTNWFTVNGEEYLVERATAEGFLMDWDEQRAGVWLEKSEVSRREVVKLDKTLRISAMRTLVPHWRGALSPMVRR